MSMISTENHFEQQTHSGGLRSALTIVVTALLTLVLVPSVALLVSYLAGGAATSTILFVYLFALLLNGPFLLAALTLTIGVVAMPRIISHVVHHGHA
jgi:hypothetical protein